MKDALGLVETKGLVTCIKAADTMGKVADVVMVGFDNVGSGMVTVIVRGDVGAVNAAVESGVQAAREIGEVVAYRVIPRPDHSADKITNKHLLSS